MGITLYVHVCRFILSHSETQAFYQNFTDVEIKVREVSAEPGTTQLISMEENI